MRRSLPSIQSELAIAQKQLERHQATGSPREITDAFGKRVPADPNRIWVDHETGQINVPSKGPKELVGPTSGHAYRDLKHKEQQHSADERNMRRCLESIWQCVRCRKDGKPLRMKGTQILIQQWDGKSHGPLNPKCRH